MVCAVMPSGHGYASHFERLRQAALAVPGARYERLVAAHLGEGVVGSDYRSEIFYTSDEQRQVAEDTIADANASGLWPGKVVTKISQAGPFWEAEAGDQDYLQRYTDGNNQFSPYRSAAR
jgi:hypothetical protein